MKNQKILVVEDDNAIREVLVNALRIEGYKVEQAANGKEALEYLKSHREPCLVLTDLFMPEMDGNQLIAAMRNIHRFVTIPIVAVSASMFPNVPKDVKVIKKLFDLDKILDQVNRYCSL